MKLAAAALVLGLAGCASTQPTVGDKALLLVAHPSRMQQDTEFRQTVALVGPGPEGSMVGVIINRATRRSLASLFPDQPSAKPIVDPAFYGGPRSKAALVALLRAASPPSSGGSVQIMNGVHLVLRANAIDRIMEETPNDARYYVGYLSWKQDELKAELAAKRWLALDAEIEPVFRKDVQDVWYDLVERALDADDPELPRVLFQRAYADQKAGHFAAAEPRYRRALALREARGEGATLPAAMAAGNLAAVYFELGRYAQAEPLYMKALSILEKLPEQQKTERMSVLLYNIGMLYKTQGRTAEARRYFARSEAIEAPQRNRDTSAPALPMREQ